MYLRQFRNLKLVNLAGNPFCKEHDYRRCGIVATGWSYAV